MWCGKNALNKEKRSREGYSKQSPCFLLAESLPRKRGVFLLLFRLSLSIITGHKEFPHLVMLLNLIEIFILLFNFSFLSTSFSERITWKCPVSPFSIFLFFQCQEEHFLGVVSTCSRKVHRLETYWKYIRVTRSRRKNSQMPFIWNSYIIMIIGIGDHLKCYVIIKGLATNFLMGLCQITLESSLIRCYLASVSREADNRLPEYAGPARVLMLYLGVSHEFKSLFLRVAI